MARLIFAPFSIAASLLAGLLAGKVFERIWAIFDDDEPPEPSERDALAWKVVLGAAVRSAVFGGTRVLTDRGARKGFLHLFGVWPGEKP